MYYIKENQGIKINIFEIYILILMKKDVYLIEYFL